MCLFAVAPLLLCHERAEAFFGVNISTAQLYTLAAIALIAVLLIVVIFVFATRKLIRTCRAQNSLRPACMALTVIVITGLTAAYFHNNARTRD